MSTSNRTDPQNSKTDCQSCRLLGSGMFVFIAGYLWHNTRGGIYGAASKRIPIRLAATGMVINFFGRDCF